MINKEDLEVITYIPNDPIPVSRVWIGQVCIAEVYHRMPKNDLFTQEEPYFDFRIHPFEKIQPEGDWLIQRDDYLFKASSLDEGLDWILNELNTK